MIQSYQRLRSAGKKPLVALVAVMRKLILLLNRLLKNPDLVLQHAHLKKSLHTNTVAPKAGMHLRTS
jgi:hypothetical protein